MVTVSKNSIMDEIQDRGEEYKGQTQKDLPTEPLHVELFPNPLLNEILKINEILTYPPGFLSNRYSLNFTALEGLGNP